MMLLSNDGFQQMCKECGKPATCMWNSNIAVAQGVNPQPAWDYYCDRHTPYKFQISSSGTITKAAFKRFLTKIHESGMSWNTMENLLDDETDELIAEWFYEWMQE